MLHVRSSAGTSSNVVGKLDHITRCKANRNISRGERNKGTGGGQGS